MVVLAAVTANVRTARVRRVRVGNASYLVAPMTLIVPGVLAGSQGALYYPPDEVAADVQQWNNVPLVVNHPVLEDGRHVSAGYPGVLDAYGIGHLRNARLSPTGSLKADGWFNEARLDAVEHGPWIKGRLLAHKPLELSTGLFTDNVPVSNGTCPRTGRPYTHVARNYRADHLAILPTAAGACSLRDGCGVLVNQGVLAADADAVDQATLNLWSQAARAASAQARRLKREAVGVLKRAGLATGRGIAGSMVGRGVGAAGKAVGRAGVAVGRAGKKAGLAVIHPVKQTHGHVKAGFHQIYKDVRHEVRKVGTTKKKLERRLDAFAARHGVVGKARPKSRGYLDRQARSQGFKSHAHRVKAMSKAAKKHGVEALLRARRVNNAREQLAEAKAMSRLSRILSRLVGNAGKTGTTPTTNAWSETARKAAQLARAASNKAHGSSAIVDEHGLAHRTVDALRLTDKAEKQGSFHASQTHDEAADLHGQLQVKHWKAAKKAKSVDERKGHEQAANDHLHASFAHRDAAGALRRENTTANAQPSNELDVTPAKACKILKDGEVQGHPLTAAQRGMFGARCGQRGHVRNEDDESCDTCNLNSLLDASDGPGDAVAEPTDEGDTVWTNPLAGNAWSPQAREAAAKARHASQHAHGLTELANPQDTLTSERASLHAAQGTFGKASTLHEAAAKIHEGMPGKEHKAAAEAHAEAARQNGYAATLTAWQGKEHDAGDSHAGHKGKHTRNGGTAMTGNFDRWTPSTTNAWSPQARAAAAAARRGRHSSLSHQGLMKEIHAATGWGMGAGGGTLKHSRTLADGSVVHTISHDDPAHAVKKIREYAGSAGLEHTTPKKTRGGARIGIDTHDTGKMTHFHFVRNEGGGGGKSGASPAKKTTLPPPVNLGSFLENGMKLKPAQRAAVVNYLVANCDCWKGPEALTLLQSASDDLILKHKADLDKHRLESAVANAATERLGLDLTGVSSLEEVDALVANAAGAQGRRKSRSDPDDDDDDIDDEVVGNTDANLTASQRERLAYADREIAKQKRALVARLTANVQDPKRRKAKADELLRQSVAQLEGLAELLPPVGNRGGYRRNADEEGFFLDPYSPRGAGNPTANGADGGVDYSLAGAGTLNASSNDADADELDTLDIPTPVANMAAERQAQWAGK